VLTEARQVGEQTNAVLETVGPEEQARIQSTIATAEQMIERADEMVQDAQQSVEHIQQGRGTVGAMLMDEELYDDVQEMLRELKHNPWRLFWRE
jgi:phospholipid/cholesterol/gamma-HCH transport system substrate-binding protein